MKYFIFNIFILLLSSIFVTSAEDPTIEKVKQKDKAFARGIFNVVQFPNTGCAGTTGRNGTCYTSSECSTKGGTSSGTCANGYGVCCIVQLVCGQTSSENCTYLVQGATTAPATTNCVYRICPNNANICRIRLDLTTFDINGPFAGTVAGAAAASTALGSAIGDCTVDSFEVTSPGNRGSPEICGFNSGQHIFVDASNACSKVSFRFGPTSYSRQYDIKVTQYNCNDELAGPPDCLQYFTSNTGTVKSFNFKLSGGLVTSSVTHLSNQQYDMCFRRNSGKCAICFIPSITGVAAVINQNSFGLSASEKSQIDNGCTTDYLIIPNGINTVASALGTGLIDGSDRFCGRYLNFLANTVATESICTGRRPFRLTFRTDADEATTGATAAQTQAMNSVTDEMFSAPGAIIGFSLDYVQQSCP